MKKLRLWLNLKYYLTVHSKYRRVSSIKKKKNKNDDIIENIGTPNEKG